MSDIAVDEPPDMELTFYFWDTSALLKRYFVERGSDDVNQIFSPSAGGNVELDRHYACQLIRAEIASAIVRRAGDAESVEQLLTRFEHDAADQLDMLSVDDDLVDESIEIIRQHRLRGCDSLHLAAALRLRAELNRDKPVDLPPIDMIFVCADGDLNTAAAAEGLAVVDPNANNNNATTDQS